MSPFGSTRTAPPPLGQEVSARPESATVRELQYLEKNMHALMCTIETLRHRLDIVLVPQPTPDRELKNATGGGSSLALQLSGFNSILTEAINEIENIQQGLDL